jgi:hypothetical protein
MRYRDLSNLGNCEKFAGCGSTITTWETLGKNWEFHLPKPKVSPVAKPSLRAQSSQLLPGHHVQVAIERPRGPAR